MKNIRETKRAASVVEDIKLAELEKRLPVFELEPMMWEVAAEVLPLLSETGAVWALNPDP